MLAAAGDVSVAAALAHLPAQALGAVVVIGLLAVGALISLARAVARWEVITWPWSGLHCTCAPLRLPGLWDAGSAASKQLRYDELASREEALVGALRRILGSDAADENEAWAANSARLSELLRGGYLDLASIASAEGMLDFFAAHRALARGGPHCSLGIRMTVQYNLFSGTIIALGSGEQRRWLEERHAGGELGCFLLTETGAGVLSGLVVETTATWAPGGGFDLHSPAPSAEKVWISQGLSARWGVAVARLVHGGVDHGPHAFIVDMHAAGVVRSDMGTKTTFNALDNARVRFDHVALPANALLSKFSAVEEGPAAAGGEPVSRFTFSGDRPPNFVIIAQRLLSGRLCIADNAIVYAAMILDATEKFAAGRMVWIDKERRRALADLPYMRTFFERTKACLSVFRAFLLLLQTRFADAAARGEAPSRGLVTLIAAAKVEAVEFAINAVGLLRRNVGSFSLMQESPFGASNDVLLCCRFAEGDSRVLQQSLTRDLIRTYSRPRNLASLVLATARTWLSGHGVGQGLTGHGTDRLRYLRDTQLLRLLWRLRRDARRGGGTERAQTDAWLDAGDLVYDVAKAHAQYLVHDTVQTHFGRTFETEYFSDMSTRDCPTCAAY